MGKKTAKQIAAQLQERKRKAFEAVNLSPDMAKLQSHDAIEITRAGEKRDAQKVSEDSARRLDAFEALRSSMKAQTYVGCYDAARQYEHQLLVRRGENDRGPSSERVDRTAGFTTDAMIDAAMWIEDVNKRLPPRDWWLLMELIQPRIERATWRETVQYITGESHMHSQGAVVRAMTVNLRDAIKAVDTARIEAKKKAA